MIFLDFKMLILIEKESPFFDKETAKEHFTLNRDNLDDTDGFEALLDAGLFYNVYSRGYVGSIFAYQSTDGRWYMGGFFYALKAGRVCKCVQYGAMWHKCVQHGAKQGKKIHHDTRGYRFVPSAVLSYPL